MCNEDVQHCIAVYNNSLEYTTICNNMWHLWACYHGAVSGMRPDSRCGITSATFLLIFGGFAGKGLRFGYAFKIKLWADGFWEYRLRFRVPGLGLVLAWSVRVMGLCVSGGFGLGVGVEAWIAMLAYGTTYTYRYIYMCIDIDMYLYTHEYTYAYAYITHRNVYRSITVLIRQVPVHSSLGRPFRPAEYRRAWAKCPGC